MPGLGLALAQGFTGYMAGQQQAEQRRYERQMEAEKIKRDAERDALQKLLLEHQMKMSGDQNRRANETNERNAMNDGFRPVGSKWDEFNDAIGLDPSALPTTTVNGVQMRRSAPSSGYAEFITKQREGRMDASAKAVADAAAREAAMAALPPSARQMAAALPTSALQSAVGSQLTRQLTPKEGPRPLTQVGGDGNMYFSTDGGRSWRRSAVEGMGGSDAPQATSVGPVATQAQRPAGDTLMRGLGIQQMPSQPPMGPFGKRPDEGGKEVEKFQSAETATKEMVSLLKQYKDAVQTNGTAMWDGNNPQRNAMQGLQRYIAGKLKSPDFINLGVLTGPDLEFLNDIVSPASGFSAMRRGTGGISAQIDQLLNNIELGRRTRYEQMGMPYQPLIQRNEDDELLDLARQHTGVKR